MEKLTLTPNVPMQIALKFPDGKCVEGRFGDQVMFSLTNSQVLYLDTDVAAKINALELRKNEPFGICKRWTGKKGDSIRWDIFRLDPGSITAATCLGTAALEAQIASERQHQVIPSMPAVPTLGREVIANGSEAGVGAPAPATAALQPPSNINGNGNKPSNGNGQPPDGSRPYTVAGIPIPSLKIGYDIALRRILRVTIVELKAAGEQWSDAARQDLVSTLMIQAARDGFISWAPLAKGDCE